MYTMDRNHKRAYIFSWLAIILYSFAITYYTIEFLTNYSYGYSITESHIMIILSYIFAYIGVLIFVFFLIKAKRGDLIPKIIWIGTILFLLKMSFRSSLSLLKSFSLSSSTIIGSIPTIISILLIISIIYCIKTIDSKKVPDRVYKGALYKIVGLFFIAISIINFIYLFSFFTSSLLYLVRGHSIVFKTLLSLSPKILFVSLHFLIFYLLITKKAWGYILSMIFLTYNSLLFLSITEDAPRILYAILSDFSSLIYAKLYIYFSFKLVPIFGALILLILFAKKIRENKNNENQEILQT